MPTPNPVLPTDAERRRNRAIGHLRRARNSQLKARIDGDEHIEACATRVIDKLLDDLAHPVEPTVYHKLVADSVPNVGGYRITTPAAAQAARLGLSRSELLTALNGGTGAPVQNGDKWHVPGARYTLTIHPKNSTLLAVERRVTAT